MTCIEDDGVYYSQSRRERILMVCPCTTHAWAIYGAKGKEKRRERIHAWALMQDEDFQYVNPLVIGEFGLASAVEGECAGESFDGIAEHANPEDDPA